MDQEILKRIGKYFVAFINKYELFVIFTIIIGIVLQYFHVPYYSLILIISFSILIIAYYFGSFALNKDEHASNYEKFVDKFAGMSNSIAVMGVFFKVLNWPLYSTILPLGFLLLVIALPTMIVFKLRKSKLTGFDKRILTRVSIIFLVETLFLFFTHRF